MKWYTITLCKLYLPCVLDFNCLPLDYFYMNLFFCVCFFSVLFCLLLTYAMIDFLDVLVWLYPHILVIVWIIIISLKCLTYGLQSLEIYKWRFVFIKYCDTVLKKRCIYRTQWDFAMHHCQHLDDLWHSEWIYIEMWIVILNHLYHMYICIFWYHVVCECGATVWVSLSSFVFFYL